MKKILIIIMLSLLLTSSVLGVTQYLLDNTSGRGIYRIYDLTSVTAINLYGILNASYISNAPWIISYTETDPIYSAWDKDYNDLTNRPNLSIYNDSSAIALKLDATDQRYNETSSINTQTGRIDSLNSSKALAGASAACTYGVANFTLNAQGVPSVTCASAQGDITGVTATGPGLTGGGTSGGVTVGLNGTYVNLLWNETGLINSINSSLQSEISLQSLNNASQASLISALDLRESTNNNTQNTLIELRLLATDQRYNESSQISSVNTTLNDYFNRVDCNGENVFLYGQDVTYNYCKTVNVTALGVPYSSLTGFAANCPTGQVVNGVTYPVSCVVDNTTDDTARNNIIAVNNSLMTSKLNITDQRYNETLRLNDVNTTAINALPKSGGLMSGNITISSNIGLVYNSTNYAIFNGTCWITRASNTYSIVCP